MVLPLLKRNVKQTLLPFAAIFALLCMYFGVIIYMYDPSVSEMLTSYQEIMPEMMAAVGMTGIADSLLEWIQIYLYGFLMILLPLILIVILVNRYVAQYLDSGSMAYLLSSPNSRAKLIVTQMITLYGVIFLLMAAVCVMGIGFSQVMFSGDLDIEKFLLLNGYDFLLQCAVGSICFAAACLCRESKQYYALGAGIPLVFFLFQMLGNMGGDLEVFRYMTLYSLLPAEQVLEGDSGALWYGAALFGITAVLSAAGVIGFQKRDLSL
ncbi:MAG: ABC transporter permease subunit [Massiliimalia sp.]